MPASPIVETQMLIRKPVQTVFNAFIDPGQTVHFWFTKSSGSLQQGAKVLWQWEMYGAEALVEVVQIIPNEKIALRWREPQTAIDFLFTPIDGHTLVVIKNYDLHEEGAALIETIKDLTGGFTTVLDGAKAWLEHGIDLNLTGDKFPARLKK